MEAAKLKSNIVNVLPCYPLYENISHDQQIDQTFFWMEQWSEKQICVAIRELLFVSSLKSKNLICTILEPLLHRDYIYHKFDIHSSFCPISTYITRELTSKLERDVNRMQKIKGKSIFRLKSAHMRNEVDAKAWSDDCVCPNMKTLPSSFAKSQIRSMPLVENHPKSRNQWSLIPHSKDSYEVWFNPIQSNDTQERVLHSKANLHPRHKTAPNRHIFQSPSNSTFSRRSKTICLPAIKTAPACFSRKYKLANSDEEIFHRLPLSLKTSKRHMELGCYHGEKMQSQNNIKQRQQFNKATSLQHFLYQKFQKSQGIGFKEQLNTINCWFLTWTCGQQDDFLKLFLKILSPSQIYYLYASLMVRLHCDIISLLPRDLSIRIFMHLKPKQVNLCGKVCTKWRDLAIHDTIWKKWCKVKKIKLPDHIKCTSYRDVYLWYLKIKQNWIDRKFSAYELTNEVGSVTSVDLFGDLVASSSSDKTIRIWQLSKKQCVKILEGHQKLIWCVKFISHNLLASCSNDQTIKIWNIKDKTCTRTLVGHTAAVWCLDVDAYLLASGSADKTVKLWNLRSCSVICSFNILGGVHSISISNTSQKIFAGTINKTVCIWSIATKLCIVSFQMTTKTSSITPVTSLSLNKGLVLCACGTDLQIWDTDNYAPIFTLDQAHKDRIESVQMQLMMKSKENSKSKTSKSFIEKYKGNIITSSKDGVIKIWNMLNIRSPDVIAACEEPVTCIKFDDSNIVCSRQDGMIGVYEFTI